MPVNHLILRTALIGREITNVEADISDHGVIHELKLTLNDNQYVYVLPLAGTVAVEFQFKKET